MKKEREILWVKPTPRGEDIDYHNRHTLTKEEEKKLFAGKLNPKDVIARVNKEKGVASKTKLKRKAPALTKGKK